MKKYIVLVISIAIFIISFPLGEVFKDKLIFSINGPFSNANKNVGTGEFYIDKQNNIELRVQVYEDGKSNIKIKLISPKGKTIYYANSSYNCNENKSFICDVKAIKKEKGWWKYIIDKRKAHNGYYNFEVVEKK